MATRTRKRGENAGKQSFTEKKVNSVTKKDETTASGKKKTNAKTDAKTCDECQFNLPNYKFGYSKFVAKKKDKSVSKMAVDGNIDRDTEVKGVVSKQLKPHNEFVLPNGRQVRMEIDTRAGKSIVPTNLIDRLELLAL